MAAEDIVTLALQRESLALCAYDDAASGLPGYSLTHAVAEVLGITAPEDLTALSNFVMASPFGHSALDSYQEFVACVNAYSSQRTTLSGVNMVVLRSAIKCAQSPCRPRTKS